MKFGRNDPGARFGAFDFSYRLPFLRKWLTLYTDGEVHDDVSPIDAPRRAAWRPGLYLSHVPGVPKLDIRAEAVYTDPPVSTSEGGHFMYWESIQKQGYTNNGQIFGDWIGREAKGGQGWITWHLSGNEWIQVGMRNQKAAKDFIPGSTTETRPGTPYLMRAALRSTTSTSRPSNASARTSRSTATLLSNTGRLPSTSRGSKPSPPRRSQLTWYPVRKVSF